MHIESLVKSTVELQGFRVILVIRNGEQLEVKLAPDHRFRPCCGQCGKPATYRDTRRLRSFRHVPLWGIPVSLCYSPRRVSCEHCHGIHMESLPWVSGKRRFTRALMVTLATWARVLTWKQVAVLFHCSWGTVAAAVEEAVNHGLAQRDLSGVTHIGVDEISRKRGHVYVTNVYDLNTKVLLWSGEGRGLQALETFFDFLGEERTAQL
jgi:transposase